MEATRKKTKTSTNQFLICRPCGPVAQMVAFETKGKGVGAKTRLMQDAIVNKYGAKYPKLAERYRVLVEEGAA